MLPCPMIRPRYTPRYSFDSRLPAHGSRSSSAYAHERPQTQSPHVFTSQLSGYPGVGGLPPFSVNSAPSALRSTRSFTSLDSFDTCCCPLIYPACPVYPESRREPQRAPIPFRIRTYEKHAPNPFGMRSSKTKDLKLFRMCSYKKRGAGTPATRRDDRRRREVPPLRVSKRR